MREEDEEGVGTPSPEDTRASGGSLGSIERAREDVPTSPVWPGSRGSVSANARSFIVRRPSWAEVDQERETTAEPVGIPDVTETRDDELWTVEPTPDFGPERDVDPVPREQG